MEVAAPPTAPGVAAAKAAVRSTLAQVGVEARRKKYAPADQRGRASAALDAAKERHAEALIALRIQEIAAAAPPMSHDARARLGALIASVGGSDH